LKAYDNVEDAYRNAFARTRAAGGSLPEARVAAEREMIEVLRIDPHYGAVEGGVDQARRVKGGAVPLKSVDQTLDEVLANQSPGQLRAAITPAEMRTVREKLVKEFRQQYGATMTDAQIESLVHQMPRQAIERRVLSDRIYFDHYHGETAVKPRTITQERFAEDLKGYTGPHGSANGWHVRIGSAGEPVGDVKRFYLNVTPDQAPALTNYVTSQLNAHGVRFNFKVIENLESFNRADAAMLYVQGADYQAVRQFVMDYARARPEAFVQGAPALTKPIGRGIAVAEEPAQMGLPFRPGNHSFGHAASDVMAEAIMRAPAGATKEEVKALAREHLKAHGFDPDRPWLRQGTKVDNL
jgi:hypothetical protein